MAIPKTIHYVWVGGNPKPDNIKKCMKTWKLLKGYEIIEWNENNFDIDAHEFTKRAYADKKWAFVSDYIRAWAIYNYGGIYLDTDVIVLETLDSLLDNKAFVGYETPNHPFTAVFGAEPNHPLIKDMLDYYIGLEMEYKFGDNNTLSVSNLLISKYGCKTGNVEQDLETGIHVYPEGILCNLSKDSKTIHVFEGSWVNSADVKDKAKRKRRNEMKLRLNTKLKTIIYLFFRKIFLGR